jgi:hypothetical protein
MGWTYFQAPAGKRSVDILRDKLKSLTWIDAQKVGDTIYAAVTHPKVTGAFALVVLIDRRGGQFGYKDMDEAMGPYESECPARILNELTAEPNEYAAAWRQRCREFNARRETAAAAAQCAYRIAHDAEPSLFD